MVGGPGSTWNQRFSELVRERSAPPLRADEVGLIGVFPGEGIGPEVTVAARTVLDALAERTGQRFEVVVGGAIGLASRRSSGHDLDEAATRFCAEVFDRRGAILAGPGGGRFVYELRQRFDLYCKLSPVFVAAPLVELGALRAAHVEGVDVLVFRDNVGGVYQGESRIETDALGNRCARHSFEYTERTVRRLVDVAARAAAQRRGRLSVILKNHGMPAFSELWQDLGAEAATSHGVDVEFLDVDYAAYRFVQKARELDVVVASNLFGDILCDLGALFAGSRGLGYSASYSAEGAAVYQTNHGAAYDLAGSDRANPAGHILSLAMLLHESFGLSESARLIVLALEEVWRGGGRTDDLGGGSAALGTRSFTERVVAALESRAVAREARP